MMNCLNMMRFWHISPVADLHRRNALADLAVAFDVGGVEARGDQQASDAADAAGQRIDRNLPAVGVDARQPHRLLLRAEREGRAAEDGLAPALAEYRRLGYRIGSSQQIRGVDDLSVPVLAFGGRAIAVLTCPYIGRLDDVAADIDQALAALREVAAKLSTGSVRSDGGT